MAGKMESTQKKLPVLLDMRERGLIAKLPLWQTKALHVGDIWIGLSGEELQPGSIVAERKTANDLEASILDKRYREQRTRLLAHCNERGARPLYIIEGDLDRLDGRLTKQVLLKYLTRLTLRYGISVLQTSSLSETAELSCLLLDQWTSDKTTFIFQTTSVAYTETVGPSRKENRMEILPNAMLQQCPGVSAKIATALLNTFGGSFSAFINASESELACVKVGTRKVGPAVAKRLWNVFHDIVSTIDKAPLVAPTIQPAPIADNNDGTSSTNNQPQPKEATIPKKESKLKTKTGNKGIV